MDEVLKDRLAPKKRRNESLPGYRFSPITKDQAMSGCISAGNNYGSGVAQPVGKTGLSSKSDIPKGSHRFSSDQVFYGEDKKG